MGDILKENVNIHLNIVFDFITSLARIENNKKTEELLKEIGIAGDNNIDKWVNHVYDSFDKKQKNKLSFYFGGDNPLGLGIIEYAYNLLKQEEKLTIENFITKLYQLDDTNILYYMLNEGYNADDKFSVDLLEQWINTKKLYDIIDSKFEFTTEGKWSAFKLLSKPEESKQELIALLEYYYNNFYIDEEEKVNKFLQNYYKENVDFIKETAIKFINNFFTSGDNSFDYNREIKVILIYFGEIMSITEPDKNYTVIGFNYHKFITKTFSNINNIEEQAHIFKALGDETRLKILQELLNGPKYMTELGEKLDVSTPTINYHIKKFLNAGLIQIDKAENRIYYKVRRDILQNVIKLLKENYNL